MILDAIVRGSWDTLGTFLPPLGLIGWLVFVLLWRPALIVGTERVIIREILRTTTVPLADISDIRLSTVPEHRLAARTNRGGANIRSHRLGDGSLLHPAVDRLLSVQSIER